MQSGILLDIQRLTVIFPDKDKVKNKQFTAVNHISLQVEKNSFTAIVGESGSGKSVTALSVGRLVKPYKTEGQIFLNRDGEKPLELLSLPPADLLRVRGKEISYVFQDPGSSLNPVIKIGDQLLEARQAHAKEGLGDSREKVFAIMKKVKLGDAERIYESYPHELSGGMKQRVMIAMALLTGARILIADEPTTALDAETELEILNLLMGLKNESGLTILFITHNLPMAIFYSDKIYVMKKGEIVESLKKENNFIYVNSYTKKLFSAQLKEVAPKSYLEVEA